MDEKIYELIIVGGGPAGMTAAVYAARKKIDFIIISADIGGQAAWSGDIENYTGYQFISGPELTLKFQEHMSSFGIEIQMPKKVASVVRKDGVIIVATDKEQYRGRTVILATGKRPRELNIPGEKEYKNKGVTYCATCDGPLFKGRPVAVIGGGNSALDAVLQLVKLCPRVDLINRERRLSGDPVMIEKVQAAAAVTIWNNAAAEKIYGDLFVQGIDISQAGKTHSLEVNGVFVEIGLMPNSECAERLKMNARNEIEVDCSNRTSVDGIFAAGDVTNVPEKQIIIACGEGAKACLSAFRYLATHAF